jgi:hypothetical protein
MTTREPRSAERSRRSFLKALGVAATALPFYKMLENQVAKAQSGVEPLRFVGVGFFHGTTGAYYSRRPGETDSTYDLRYANSPFVPFDDAASYGASFKSRLAILEGFDLGVGRFDAAGNENPVPMHGSMGLLLTGSSMGPSGLQNASLDQYLAAKYGSETRFRSVQIRGYDLLGYALDNAWCMSFGTGGAAMAPLHDPLELWDKFFAGSIVGTSQEAQAAAARKRAIGASILDFVAKDISAMNARLAGPEREKLEQHLTVVRGLEKRLADVSPLRQCTPPPRRDPAASGYLLDKFKDGNVRPICDFNIELLAEILACDLTRFATFLLPYEFGQSVPARQVTLPYDGTSVGVVDGTEGWAEPVFHNLHDNGAHRLRSGNDSLAQTSQRMVAGSNRLYFERIARLMSKLEQAGILDHTVILAGSDGGDGSLHSTRQIPLLLAGGAGGALKLGRRIVAPGRVPQAGDWCVDSALTSHNTVLAAVANLFGEDLTSYGTCAMPEYLKLVPDLI